MVNPAIQDKRRYWQVRPGPGQPWATCETHGEAVDLIGSEDAGTAEIRDVWMTPREFEGLPEHGGW